jgi:hypothetical protein
MNSQLKQTPINPVSEKVIYLVFWLLVFIFPILLSSGGHGIDWVRTSHELINIFPFFLVFLLNNFLFFPLFKRKKYFQYFLFAAIGILLISFLGTLNFLFYDLFELPQAQKTFSKIDTPWILNNLFYNTIFSILVVGFNDAIKISIGWLEDKRNYEQLQKENLKNQLTLLQHQISPHFLMNTLNNIHALIDYDQEIAKNAVVKLSHLMRILLYENENYSLQKEVDFINSYIDLMKIRVNQSVEIKFEYPEIMPEVKIPPLLFINFVENAFKHGIKASGKSFIHIYFEISDAFLNVNITNSKALPLLLNNPNKNIGLNNSQKRFELIYQNQHDLNIVDTDSTYEVIIKIPLK